MPTARRPRRPRASAATSPAAPAKRPSPPPAATSLPSVPPPALGPAARGLGDAARGSVVIYIHGIGRQDPAADLKLQWDLALFGQDMGAGTRMAWWADLLRPELAPGPGGPGVRSVRRRRGAASSAAPADRPLDPQALIESAAQAAGRAHADEARALAEALLADLGVDPGGSGGGGPGKKILPLPAWLRRPISKAFLEEFVPDVAGYFFKPALRERIRQRLVAQLDLPRDQPVAVVAHSLGSVIAYEVLSALAASDPQGLDLRAFVTLGSPLGIREVQDFLVPNGRRVPSTVPRWFNFADPLDPVAADKRLAGDFRWADAPERSIDDDLVMNQRTASLPGFNPHSALGYLAHPNVRRAVYGALHLDLMSRFVVARDVAERLAGDAQERHPVLIEVLEPGYGALGESREQMQLHEQAERQERRVAAITLAQRIEAAADALEALVTDRRAAAVDRLQRFVAARLTAAELAQVARQHQTLRVYAVWRSGTKSKLTDERSLRAVKADAALASFAAAGRGVTWAVLDTGLQGNHPHFAGAVTAVWDCTRPGPPREIPVAGSRDKDGHGTHVAGLVAGRSADGKHRGLAPEARLMIYKVLDDKGQGEDAWIIKALDHIAQLNRNSASGLAVHGINLSLGGPFDSTVYGCGFSPVCKELRYQWRDGVLVVVASGNEGQLDVRTPDGEARITAAMSIGDPANLEDCIAVGSVNADKPHLYGVSAFSSRGPTADGRLKPDVVAPGERIVSCNAAFERGEPYRAESGTSMAAPHVSGLLAAFLSVRREFQGRPDEVKRLLLETSTDLARDRYLQGRGMPNLMQMLLSV
jgi:subtilisin family serine protease